MEYRDFSSVPRILRWVGPCKVEPTKLTSKPCIKDFEFDISEEEISCLQRTRASANTFYDIRMKWLRLRCCHLQDLENWAAKDSTWPSFMYFHINGKNIPLPLMDFQHRYPAIDIADFVQAGTNILRIYINLPTTHPDVLDYGVAIEVVAVAGLESVKENLIARKTIGEVKALELITRTLQKQTSEDDVVVMDPQVSIVLFEPFSNSMIFDTPVRSEKCKHRQAFDLAIYFESRPLRKGSKLTKVDCWKCPICNADARPHLLQVDGFLLAVRKDLERQGKLASREIVVHADGSWAVKPEKERSISMSTQSLGQVGVGFESDRKEQAPTLVDLTDD